MSENVAPDNAERVSAEFRNRFNTQGHGFHYSVLRRADGLFQARTSQWSFEVAELPVSVGKDETRIDFVLFRKTEWPSDVPRFLVAECKRVNPAIGRWCFVRTPYTRRGAWSEETMIFEQVINSVPTAQPLVTRARVKAYNLGEEVRVNVKGDDHGPGRGDLNSALTQVLRGVSGLINHMFEEGTSYRGQSSPGNVHFLPVIFTTAEIWVSDADLGSADLATGTLDSLAATPADWIWFNYNRSSSLRHSAGVHAGTQRGELSQAIEDEFTRTVAIVNPKGIDAFLQANLW